MRIDHVVVAVRDLDYAARRFEEELGLASVEGGVHPAWGTGNRIVPLGESYIELLGVVDEDQAAANLFGRSVLDVATEEGCLANWCVAPDDLDAAAARLGLEPARGFRDRPDGVRLEWRSMGLDVAIAEPCLPFFIAWDVPANAHPGRTHVNHPARPTGLAWVDVSGDPARIQAWLGENYPPVRIAVGPPAVLAMGLVTQRGELVIRTER
jgi:catechol 2,3-dioxygenase-like lactoylglutathione lyase family enzyme